MRPWQDRHEVEVLTDGTVRFMWPKVVLMQFTGLHDKNGQEIYEDDIVKVVMEVIDTEGYVERVGTIDWDKSDALWWVDFSSSMIAIAGLSDRNAEYEVIGNIHENPELLKDQAA